MDGSRRQEIRYIMLLLTSVTTVEYFQILHHHLKVTEQNYEYMYADSAYDSLCGNLVMWRMLAY